MMKRFDFWIGIILSAFVIVASWQQWWPVPLTEALGFVTGAACVSLVVQQSIWNFPLGIANNLFFLALFGSVRLYGDAGLQVVYIALGAQGWYHWLYGGEHRTALKLTQASVRLWLWLSGFVIVATAGLVLALRAAKGAAPGLDAFTTVLSLAAHYQTVWVAEYGREYSERKLAENGGCDWSSEEFTHIAQVQCECENEAARRANKVLFCDTDAFATGIWHRRYLYERSAAVEAIAAAHRCPDLYLLTDVNTPFEQDGTRDGEAIRYWMHETFVAELTAQQRPFQFLSGSASERLASAIAMIDALGER